MGQGTDNNTLVKFQVTVLSVSAKMWRSELLGGGQAPSSAFLVYFLLLLLFLSRASLKSHYFVLSVEFSAERKICKCFYPGPFERTI